CSAGTDTCHMNATCAYTGPGTYSCTCNTGYSGDGYACSPIGHCSAGADTCHTNATCTYTGPGTYSCACNTGYSGDGYTCTSTRGCYPYAASFTSGTTPATQCTAWNTWRAGLPSSGLGHLAMFGSEDLTGVKCTDPTAVQALANALRTGTSGTWTCDGLSWVVGTCGAGVGIGAGSSDCACTSPGHVARPCIGNDNWGGMGSATCPAGPDQDYSVVFCGETDFCACVGSWCPQAGTLGQYTRCASAADGCTTCRNPEIRYGTTTGGIPVDHSGNRYDLWCQQLDFSDYATSSVVLGTRSCTSPNGTVFGGTSWDETTWHWCDYSDGFWFDATLDYHTACSGTSITSVTCVP
ncbi:MAG: hypothetical protein JRG91_18825, partial [Deltaproteobacteria bacterium]|nr:hypothetical protein [Deltaproteobacteria bacterium]